MVHTVQQNKCKITSNCCHTETTNSALEATTEAMDEFMRSFMDTLNHVLCGSAADIRKPQALDIPALERGYFALRRDSLLSLHNYYKHDVVQRNRTDHREFQEIYAEYDRLRQESHQLHDQMRTVKPEYGPTSMLDSGSVADAGAMQTATMMMGDGGGIHLAGALLQGNDIIVTANAGGCLDVGGVVVQPAAVNVMGYLETGGGVGGVASIVAGGGGDAAVAMGSAG